MSDTHQEIKTRYLNWAEFEGRGRCEVYVDLAQWVAESDTAQACIASFEAVKRQPNLVFAALRKAYGVPMSRRELEAALMAHAEAIGAIIETHRTQTNEAARCAGLLLGLAQIDGPISLIEVGASAGLCMIPDYYSYRFGDTVIVPQHAGDDAPEITCGFSGVMPNGADEVDIVWRRGIDLHPIDLSDAEQRQWLETLVWPSQTERLKRVQAVMQTAEQQNLQIDEGHVQDRLADAVAAAPAASTIVVYHAAVMNYLAPQEVAAFRELLESLSVAWLFQENRLLFPDLLAEDSGVPLDRFAIVLNAQLLGHTHTHGADIVWL